ncbi:hypothetical protein PC9H_000601 [Pleurotus ostreatus]|uniref:SH3 domain-containing protein n=1 Tax=Pleurotus ostreatus TaxID=5322 RepID=A0A8H7DWS0_PLEOS|nr:uncharacterized protein PC9H_000601 [Pleurotus ostreatus]KAF7440257.1 hypothetical protein PC9H_000601 [Pleurotus ostreatus]
MSPRLVGRLPAGQARHIDHARRQIVSGSLTGPITITVVRPISSTSSPPSTSSAPGTVTVTTTTTRSSSSAVSTTTSSTSSSPPTRSLETSSVSSTTSSLASGFPVAMEGDTGKGVEGSSNGRDSSPQRGGLPAGAIAGIVITILLVLAALTVFLVRKRMAANRQSRSRSWKDNMFSKGINSEKYNAGGAGYGREEGVGGTITPYAFSPQPQTQHKSTPSKSIPRVPVPAMPTTSYNNPPTAGIVPTPTGEWPRSPPVVNGRTVVSTFIPSLPDEMSISMGETVRVLAEYDDGWALCMNGRGEQGMVPLECLGQDNSTQQAYVARDPSVARRASSLTGSGSVRRM